MAVDISKGGLKFTADLDDKAFQQKSDKMIDKLKLIHSLAGKNSSAGLTNEVKLRELVVRQIERQKIKHEELGKAIQRSSAASEVAIYKRSKVGDIAGGSVVGNTDAGRLANAANAASAPVQNLTNKLKEHIAATTKVRDLSLQLSSLKKGLAGVDEKDLSTITAYNAKIQQLETRLRVLSVVGKQGFDDLGRKIADKPVGAINRMEHALGRYQEMTRTATNPAIIEKYNRKIQETQAQVTMLGNRGKKGFDEMGNAVKNSGNAIQKAIGGLFRMAYLLPGIGVAGLLAFAIDPIMKYIKGLDLLKNKTKTVASEAFTSSEYKEALKNVAEMKANIEGANAGTISKEGALRRYNETIGKTSGQLKTWNELEDFQKKDVGNYLKMIELKAKAQAFLAISTEETTKALKRQTIGATWTDIAMATASQLGRGQFSISGIKRDADIAALTDASNSKEQGDKYMEEYRKTVKEGQKFAKDNGLNYFDPVDNKKSESTLNARLSREKSLMAEITKIRADASRKQLEGQAAELQTITDQYDLITKKVQDFFLDPKNKGTKLKSGQIFSDLIKAEDQELAAINKKYQDQEEKEAKEHLDDLLKKYATFEDRKKTIIAETEKEVAELKGKGYSEQAENAEKAGEGRISEVDEEAFKTTAAYKNLFDNIGKISRTETLKRIANLREELKNFKGSAEAKAKLIAELNKLEKGVDDDNKKDGEDKEKKRISELNEALTALRLIATEFDNLNDSLGSAAALLLSSAKAYVEIKENISILDSKEASTTEKVAAGAGIIGAALGVANAVVGYFKGLKAAKEAAQKAMAEFHQAAIKGERDYQELLRKRDLDTVARGKSTYQAIISQLELLKKQSPEIQKAYDKVYAALQGQSMVDGVGYQHGTWLRKAKTWDIMASLAGSDYDKLEKLYTEGKLKDQAKADFEALKTLREELEAAGVSAQSLQDQLKSLLTGTTAGGLADSLSQLFQNGKFAAKDFGDSFEEIMKNAIVNSFKFKVMEDAMKPFYDEFAALFLNGTPSATDIDALKEKYEAIGIQMGDQFKELEKITGRSLTTQDQAGTNGNTMAGAITAIRAEQADLIGARLGGIQISNLEMLAIQKQQLDLNRQCYQIAVQSLNTYLAIEQNTLRTANNTEALKDIRIGIQSMDKKLGGTPNALSASGFGGFGG